MISAQKVLNHYLNIKRYVNIPKMSMTMRDDRIHLFIGNDVVSPEVACFYLSGISWSKILKRFYLSEESEKYDLSLKYTPGHPDSLWKIYKITKGIEEHTETTCLSSGYYLLEVICNYVNTILNPLPLEKENCTHGI